MNGMFSTEIGRLRTEEMVNRAARYQAVARAQRERDNAKAETQQPRELSHIGTVIYRKALRLAAVALTVGLMLTSAVAFAAPAGPGSDPTGSVQKGTEVSTPLPVADGGTSGVFWFLTIAALVAAAAGVVVVLNRQRTPKAA